MQSVELDANGMADISLDSFDSTLANRKIDIKIEPGTSKSTSVDYTYTDKNNPLKKNKILYCTKKPLFLYGVEALIVPSENYFETKEFVSI